MSFNYNIRSELQHTCTCNKIRVQHSNIRLASKCTLKQTVNVCVDHTYLEPNLCGQIGRGFMGVGHILTLSACVCVGIVPRVGGGT